MRSFLLKSALMLLLASFGTLYINGCSTAEQTTGKIAYQQGDYEKAEKEFDLETKQNPSNEEAWFYLAMSRIELNKIGPAEVAMKQYRKLKKDNSFQSDIVKMWSEKYDQGYKAVENAKQSVSDTAVQFKLFREAINDFKAALVLIPDSTFVQDNINVINNKIATITVKPLIDKGADLIKENKYEESINYFKQAENMGLEKDNPAYDVINYNMGLAYLKWGEDIREKNKDINPNDTTYKEKYRAALPYMEELTTSKDKSMELSAWELLVQVYANLGMTDKAKDAINKRDELKKEQENNK
jgi:predicted Zn-dependent protease